MRAFSASLGLALLVLTSGTTRAQEQAAAPTGDARTIVFFAWDRPVIDGDAAAQLDGVVAAYKRAPNARLELSGHADRSGPASANVRSARLRAEAVRAHLAARGVPQEAMRVVSLGEEQPLIPTADGVREPQNRRVEIVLTPTSGG